MTILQATKSKASSAVSRSGRLFLLELSGDRIHSMNPDGSDHKVIVTDCQFPDGIAVDVRAGHIYWTNMGVPNLNDGSIERADLDGGNRKVIVPQGVTRSGRLFVIELSGDRIHSMIPDGSDRKTIVTDLRADLDRKKLV